MANESMFPHISADNEEISPMSVESLCMACEEMVAFHQFILYIVGGGCREVED